MTLKSIRRVNATKRWWKFVPCTWACSREGPVSGIGILTLSLLQHTHPPYWHRWWNKKLTKMSFLTLMYGHSILRNSFLTLYFYFSFSGLFFYSS